MQQKKPNIESVNKRYNCSTNLLEDLSDAQESQQVTKIKINLISYIWSTCNLSCAFREGTQLASLLENRIERDPLPKITFCQSISQD